MNNLSKAIFGLLIAAFALPGMAQASADNTEMRPYVSLNYDQVFGARQRLTESSGPGYSLSVGTALNRYWGLEIGGFYDRFRPETGSVTRIDSWRSYGANLDALFFYSRNPAFSPYTVLSLGVVRDELKNTGGKSTGPFGAAGAGFFKYFSIGDHDIGIRGDVRYRWTGTRHLPGYGTFGEPVVMVGLVLPLGSRPSAAGETPAAAPVDACKVDSDGDGVPDCADRCPETQRGVKVDANGCPIEANRSFEDLHFAFDKSDLTDYAKATLDNTANVINGLSQKFPKLRVDVSGHTDWIGTESYNMGLSERRANVVKRYLIHKGVEQDRIDTHAYGKTKPVAPNTTTEGRALNRRTEVRTHD